MEIDGTADLPGEGLARQLGSPLEELLLLPIDMAVAMGPLSHTSLIVPHRANGGRSVQCGDQGFHQGRGLSGKDRAQIQEKSLLFNARDDRNTV